MDRRLAALALVALASVLPGAAMAFDIVGDAIPASLTGRAGNAAQGRAIVADRTRGLCLLCHPGPVPEMRFQGNLSPDLAGAGSRWSAGQLRLRVVDSRRLNPETIMPPFGATDGLNRVGNRWTGRPILGAEEIEDVVAYLGTLKE